MPPKNARGAAKPPGKRVAAEHTLTRRRGAPAGDATKELLTLCIDIGGTGIKMILANAKGRPVTERARMLTPRPARPAAVAAVMKKMIAAYPRFDRVSVGFPGVVVDGVVRTAVNLGEKLWVDQPLQREVERFCRVPVRVINDADLQGYGVVDGRGAELVLTLGTGLGSALFLNGQLVPNLELGHHPLKKDKTYEDRVRDSELKRLGKKAWSRRVIEALETLNRIFNPRVIHLGGGNTEHLRGKLPRNVRLFGNVDGMTGGVKLWTNR